MTATQTELPVGVLPGVELADYAPNNLPQPVETLRRVQREAAQEIERLIALLDAIDGDIECEDDETKDDDAIDEPSLGAIEARHDQTNWTAGAADDREFEDEREENHDAEEENEHGGDINDEPHDDIEDEPSLGSFDRHIDQRVAWAQRWQVTDLEVCTPPGRPRPRRSSAKENCFLRRGLVGKNGFIDRRKRSVR